MTSTMLGNQTKVTEFILLGFGEFHNFQTLLFLIFLLIYIVTMTGNILITALVISDRHLHTPMYFFLGNLSVLEAFSSSFILPRMLAALQTGDRRISVIGCFTQWYFSGSFLAIECSLLCAMSYDRYLAICKPLHYAVRMNTRTSVQLAATSWIHGFTGLAILLTLLLRKLTFCGPNIMDDYFCDYFSILKLSCNDTSFLEMMSFFTAATYVFLPFLLILTSYIYIIVAILRIPSTTGRKKTFSTCSSHLVVVCVYYGSLLIEYMLPKTEDMRRTDKFSSLLYTVLPPLANPFIYSLRNKDMKSALKIMFVRWFHIKHISEN